MHFWEISYIITCLKFYIFIKLSSSAKVWLNTSCIRHVALILCQFFVLKFSHFKTLKQATIKATTPIFNSHFIRFNFISYTWFKFKFQFNSRDLSIIQSKNALQFSTNRANINCMKKCISTSKLAIYWHFIWKLAICWENYIEWFERKLLWIVICDEKRLKILARNKWRISMMLLKNV